jgi:hypothetical protein
MPNNHDKKTHEQDRPAHSQKKPGEIRQDPTRPATRKDDEQRENLMPDPDRKPISMPHTWPGDEDKKHQGNKK